MADNITDDDRTPPPQGADAERLKKFVDTRIYYDSEIWRQDASVMLKAEHYDAGHQWLESAKAAVGAGKWQYREQTFNPDDPTSVRLRTLNEGLTIRQNESARLGKPEYDAKVRPAGENPDIRTKIGAKKAQAVLRSELKRQHWDRAQDDAFNRMPLHGGFWLMSQWEQTWEETTTVPIEGAVACARHRAFGPKTDALGQEMTPCDLVLASKKVTREQVTQLGMPEPAPSGIGTKDEYEIDFCPRCAQGAMSDGSGAEEIPQLKPIDLSMDEAQGKDVLGRPLGEPKPIGNWKLHTPSPFDVFVENQGVDIDPTKIREWVYCHVESLDWVEARWPDKVRNDKGELLIQPENAATLMEYHPVVGAPNIYGQGARAAGAIYKNHVRVKEYYKKPWLEWRDDEKRYRFNRGRHIVIVGHLAMFDGDLMIESLTKPGTWIPRASVEYVPWDIQFSGRRLRGLSLWEIVFDGQDIRNEIATQKSSTRERLTVPIYLEREEHNLEVVGIRQGLPGMWAKINTIPDAPNAVPVLFNNEVLHPGVDAESADVLGFMNRATGFTEAESGREVPNVSAATHYAMMLEESAEKRKPRLRRIKYAFERAWSHGLQLVCAMWIEPRPVSWSDGKAEGWQYLLGTDLQEQTDVVVTAESGFDSAAEERENARQLVKDGIVDLQDPEVRMELAAALDAPSALFAERDIQLASAQAEWHAFLERGVRPVIDPSLDDPVSHWRQHGKDCHREEFKLLEEEARWRDALVILGGRWDQILQMVKQTVVAGLMAPDAPGPGPEMEPLDPQGMIEKRWMMELIAWKFVDPTQPSQQFQALKQVLAWRAHAEAHKLLGEVRQMVAQQQAVLAAAGAEQTEEGTVPTPGQPAVGQGQPAAAAAQPEPMMQQ